MPQQILDIFPLQQVAQPPVEDSHNENQADGPKQVQQQSKLRKSKPVLQADESDIARPGEYYRRYRTVEELPKEARAFYAIAGKLSIISFGQS